MTKDIERMEAERRRLDREIRAAKRAKAKAEQQALLSERHHLGVKLSEAVGADTVEKIHTLAGLIFDTGRVDVLRDELAKVTTAELPELATAVGQSSDTSETDAAPLVSA